jgi:hypothetical protein
MRKDVLREIERKAAPAFGRYAAQAQRQRRGRLTDTTCSLSRSAPLIRRDNRDWGL